MMPVAQKRLGRLWRAVPFKILRRGTHHALAIHDAAHAQVRVFQHAELEGDIHALAHDIDLVIGEAKPHFNVGIPVVKFGNTRRDEPPAEAERSRDANRPLRVFGQFRHCGFCLINGFKDFQCAIIKYAAMLRRRQLARGPVEEPHPQMLLQLLDSIACYRRRGALVAACRREISQFDNAQIIKI